MTKHSLAMQRQGIEHAIPFMERDCPQIVEMMKDAARTLAWLERHSELVREVKRLNERAPHLAAILQTIPGTEIVDVRSIGDEV